MPEEPLGRVYFQLQSVLEAAEDIGTRTQLPGTSQLWRAIRDATTVMCRRVSSLPAGSESGQRLAARYAQIAEVFHLLLGFIEGAQAHRVPQAVVAPLAQMVRERVGNADVILAYDWLPANYRVVPDLPDLLDAALQLIYPPAEASSRPSVPRTFPILSFPAAEKENVLLHAVLAHEIGHLFCDKLGSVDAVSAHCPLSEEELESFVSNEVRDFATALAGEEPKGEQLNAAAMVAEALRPSIRERLQNESVVVLSYWLAELLSDAWSVVLMGPASLFALHALQPVQPASDTHPPGSVRFPVMIQVLEAIGFRYTDCEGWLQDTFSAIRVDADKSAGSLKRKPAYQLAFSALSSGQAHLVDHVVGSALQGTPGKTGDALPWLPLYESTQAGDHPLVSRLLNYVPPDCTSGAVGDDLSPADIGSIMNAGWIVYLGRWAQFCAGFGADTLPAQFDARRKLNRLLLKGVELSTLIRLGKGIEHGPLTG